MSLAWVICGFVALELVLVVGKIVLVTGFVDAPVGLAIEWAGSVALLLAVLLTAEPTLGPWGALLLAAGGGVVQLATSLGGVALARATVGFGDDDVPLGPDYPLVAALLLLLVALPLATRENLLAGALPLYLGFLGGWAVGYAGFAVLERRFPGGPLPTGVLVLWSAVLVGGLYLVAAQGGSHGRALILGAIHTGLAAGLTAAVPLVGYRMLDTELDPAGTTRRAVVVLGVGLLVVGLLFASRLFAG